MSSSSSAANSRAGHSQIPSFIFTWGHLPAAPFCPSPYPFLVSILYWHASNKAYSSLLVVLPIYCSTRELGSKLTLGVKFFSSGLPSSLTFTLSPAPEIQRARNETQLDRLTG